MSSVRSTRVVRGDQIVQGSWVGDPLPVSFFCSSSPISALIGRVGVGGFSLCPDPFYLVLRLLSSFLLVSFIESVARRLHVAG